MSTSGEPADSASVWADAALASELFAVDPRGLGGIHLRAGAGPDRDRICAWVRELSAAGAPFLRVPLHVTEDRLLGGLSLAATLREGRPVNERGLLAQADGGLLVLAMAERLEPSVVTNVCAALDHGELALERDGLSARVACRVGVLALDEGLEDEKLADSLRDRLAFTIDLTSARAARSAKVAALTDGEPLDSASVGRARAHLAQVELGDPVVEALCHAAVALGVASVRAAVLAVTAARAHAALQGRASVTDVDAAVAARLVLGPRATRLPVAAEPETTEPEPAPPEEDESSPPDDPGEQEAPPDGLDAPQDEPTRDEPRAGGPLQEIVLEAARSGIPGGLLDALVTGRAPRGKAPRSGTSGAMQESTHGGRPSGTRPGIPRGGEKLNLVETLRAAAPWQRLRRRQGVEPGHAQGTAASANLVEVRKEDFRVTRFQKRTETTVIFAVDASGSAALQRLAEAKGAVEQVLADCYARRDHVALVAFRGTSATLLLPPTRSLARVRRRLADLAGGGTTPLAAGIDAALALALEARKQDKLPLVVLMTDGRANVARSGNERSAAAGDALASARAVRAAGVRALLLDTAPRPRPEARLLATEMDARYLPLPYLDAAGISRQVRSLASEAR